MEAAMQTVADRYQFSVRWQPFLLRPGMPLEGMKKPQNAAGTASVNPTIKKAGEEVGIDFTGKSDRYPNTLQAHALMEYAKEHDRGTKQNTLAEVLFKAYFTDGIYPDTKNLVALGQKVGLDPSQVKKIVTDKERLYAVRESARGWTRRGVTGVPCCFMNGQRTFSGAQDTNAFVKIFETIAEKFPLKDDTTSNL